jgi:hypothetical protein
MIWSEKKLNRLTHGGKAAFNSSFQLRNQSGDRRRWKYSLFVVHIKKPRRGGVAKLLGKNQRVSKQELNTRRGFNEGEHHTINRQRTGADS